MQQAEEMYTALWRAGCEVELLRLQRCNHEAQIAGPPPPRPDRMAAMRDWLEAHVN